jgi:hypothetical protein
MNALLNARVGGFCNMSRNCAPVRYVLAKQRPDRPLGLTNEYGAA